MAEYGGESSGATVQVERPIARESDQPGIVRNVSALQDTVARATHLVGVLEERLEPAMRPDQPGDTALLQPPKMFQSQHADVLASIETRVRYICSRLELTIERLDL